MGTPEEKLEDQLMEIEAEAYLARIKRANVRREAEVSITTEWHRTAVGGWSCVASGTCDELQIRGVEVIGSDFPADMRHLVDEGLVTHLARRLHRGRRLLVWLRGRA